MTEGWTSALFGPTPYGWVIVLLYVAAALLCYRSARIAAVSVGPSLAAAPRTGTERRVWLALAIVLLLLGINKQIDLQTLLTVLGRAEARQEGWYGDRRVVQREVIVAVLLAASAVGITLALLGRQAGGWAVIAVMNTTALVAFVMVRAASLHGVDALLARGWGPVTVNRCLEIGSIALDMLAALAVRRHASTG